MAKAKESGFYKATRGSRGVTRAQFNVRLDERQKKKLIALSRKMKLTGSEVVRVLIEAA